MSVVTTDLAEWLTQIWDEQESSAGEALEQAEWAEARQLPVKWQWVWTIPFGDSSSAAFAAGAPSPQQMLARIAADRQILALHIETVECGNMGCKRKGLSGLHCIECDEPAPCKTASLLALPYADRLGYREEWKP